MPLSQLVNGALNNFELDRDIYVYGQTDEETAVAASTYALQGWQHWLTEQKEVLVGIAILLLITYAWLLVKGL